ncbi:unnamed protein product [Mytilus coruscus]|uniref:Uncharacterized protein n=1 Tax=Mytilus coruscus TaxID=42192 RepID=A0A6J8C068_MYTCO|nr:unnamed protein product [Mytilus coruscus]
MSFNNLQKQLDRFEDEVFFDRVQRRKAFLLSDSKGRYLKDVVQPLERIVDIVYKGGAKIDDAVLYQDLRQKITGLDNPLILIWLGTCEFTKKTGRYISLHTEISVSDVLDKLGNLKANILDVNSSAEILILKCPAYSIEHYNKYHRHPDSESFHDDDSILQDKIQDLNDKLVDLNTNFPGSNFSLDLIKNTKVNKGRRSKYVFMFKDLYTDGIHPCPTLSMVWLRKIQKIVCKLCF